MKKTILVLSFLFVRIMLYAQYSNTQIQQFYSGKLAQFGLSAADAEHFIITSQYTDKSTGVTHIYIRQTVNGIEIFNANSDLHTDKNGNLLAIHNQFEPNVKQRVNATYPVIQPLEALQRFGLTIGKSISVTLSKNGTVDTEMPLVINNTSLSREPIEIKKYYLIVEDEIKLVWNVEFYDNSTGDWWNARMDALTGELIEKNNWTVKCHPVSMKSQHELNLPSSESQLLCAENSESSSFGKSGTGTYNVLPLPVESPNFGSRQIVNGTPTSNASPFGWHDTDGVAGADWTITRGNNVYASDDTANKNIPGFSPDGGVDLTFDYPYSPNNPSAQNLPAVITNLFYWNNLNHDIFYNYGFDEVAGNFQVNNYGKGGLAHDGIFADAQDGSGTNNANFSTPVDGKRPRMQMFLFPKSTTGAKDNLIIHNTDSAGTYTAPPASFGPVLLQDINTQLMLAKDGSTDYSACDSITNDLTGKIALIFRGGACSFQQKIVNAQKAGAVAVIIVNNNNTTYIMTGASAGVTIPAVMISFDFGAALRDFLLANTTVSVTLIGDSNLNAEFDSDMDDGIMTHEHGHGISNRLTGGPANTSCLNYGEQCGEGWSDFFALCLTARASDTLLDGRGSGTWVLNEKPTAIGARTFKYSHNMSVNPLTYKSIKSNPDPHAIGAVWCTMLYDAYLDFVSRYGFNPDIYQNDVGGNNKFLQLVIDGLKLQPCNPGFVDARNAILLADSIRNGGANNRLLWRVFARRGLGLSALQGKSTSSTDGTEAFDLPPQYAGMGTLTKAWENVTVFPNPTRGMVKISVPDQLNEIQIDIYDMTGKRIYNSIDKTIDIGTVALNLSSYEKGIYILKLSSGENHFQSKLIVE